MVRISERSFKDQGRNEVVNRPEVQKGQNHRVSDTYNYKKKFSVAKIYKTKFKFNII